jgi:hypothetical protein
MAEAVEPTKVRAGPAVSRSGLFRLAREWHGYLSAIAFVALLFFSATGIVMNHPTITDGHLPDLIQKPFMLSPAEIAAIRANPDPGQTLVKTAERHIGKLRGGFRDGQLDGNDAFVRLQGASNNTDLHADLKSGRVEVTIVPAGRLDVLNNLHRGDRAGKLWQALVDASAILMILVSLLGYILFLSMRFRVRTALILTGATTLALVAIFFLVVP